MISTCAPSFVPRRGVLLDEILGVILTLCAYAIYTPLRFFFSLENLLKPRQASPLKYARLSPVQLSTSWKSLETLPTAHSVAYWQYICDPSTPSCVRKLQLRAGCFPRSWQTTNTSTLLVTRTFGVLRRAPCLTTIPNGRGTSGCPSAKERVC